MQFEPPKPAGTEDAAPGSATSEPPSVAAASATDPIADSVAAVGLTVLGDAPAVAMGQIYQSLAHTTGLMFQNAVTAQQNMNMASQAATVQGIMQLYGVAAPAPSPSEGALETLVVELLAELRRDD